MRFWFSLFVMLILIAIPWFVSGTATVFFAVVMPYIALVVFLVGIALKLLKWSRSAVPFRIPTTSGQQKSLSFIKNDKLESPPNAFWTTMRMAAEILFFRSLFRNTATDIKEDRNGEERVVYGSSKYLWAAGMAFHYTFLIIVLRHFDYFSDPTPFFVPWINAFDGWVQIGLPVLYMTDALFLAAVGYLFVRRVWDPKIRYITMAQDWFPLLLILSIGTTGVLMRYFMKTDIVSVKEYAVSLFGAQPTVPAELGTIFWIHLFLVCCLLIYFPFSKLMHMAGVFLSPTRNLANNNRMKQHVNPWNYDVKVHTYAEYEEEFHTVMKAAGLPLEKEYADPKPAAKEAEKE